MKNRCPLSAGPSREPVPGRNPRAGLTLVEVLIATAILAAGLTALISATGRCLAVARKAKEFEIARRLIGQVDLEIPPDFEEIEEGTESGRFSGDYSDYSWERDIVAFEDEEFELYTVTTRVIWSSRGSRAQEEVSTYIYGPTYVRGGAGGRR